LAVDAADVEERLAKLERIHAVVRRIREHELPDGTPSLRFGFVHALFQNAFYEALQPTRRASLSLAVADALLAHHRGHVAAVATEAAFLLEVARDHARAADLFCAAGESAVRGGAEREATMLARRGLALLPKLAESPARATREL